MGEGPIPGPYFFCGEGPGVKESATGRPFVETAPAGAELTRYLNGYSLPTRDQWYITNLIKEWAKGAPTKGKGITPEDIARDEWELNLELATVEPRIVGALGLYAARWFLGPGITMDASHGLLFRVLYCPTCGGRYSVLTPSSQLPCSCHLPTTYVMPIYHPAAGLHQPELAARTAYDLAQLAAILKCPPSEWESRLWQPSPPGVYQEYTWPNTHPATSEQAVDTEGTPEQPWGLSLSTESGTAEVKRCGIEYEGDDQSEDPILNPEGLPQTTWILHNYLWDAHVLKAMGAGEIPEDRFHDSMLMAYLLGVEPQGLKELAFRHLGRVRPSYEETVGEWQVQYGKTGKPKKKKKLVLKSLDEIPLDKAVQYAGGDADDTLSIKPILWKRVQDLGLEGVYEIDRKVLPLYARMEEVGLPVDVDYYRQFREEIEGEILISSLTLQDEYPGLNPDSPDQVAALLFETLHLPGGKKTPTGKRFSTEDKYLETLVGWHPVVARIQNHRELQKTKTFIDDVFQFSHPGPGGDTRLYFRLLPTRVVSGRVAYKDPNVGAFPKRSEKGKRFRRGVRARPGRLLGSWDFSQIELRVLALDSAPSPLQELIASGVDLHGRTGEKIFGVSPAEQDQCLHRIPSKTTNFSIIMGTTKVGLAEQQRKNGYPFPELHGTHFASLKVRREAEEEVCDHWIRSVIDDWGIAGYITDRHAEARRYGCVRDRWGRIRWLPSMLSPNRKIREEAQRQAQAFPPQAGARGFVKQWEAEVWRTVIKPLREEGWYVEPLLDLHDDLVLEFDAALGPMLQPVIESVAVNLFGGEAVPIVCKGSVGGIWGDL